MQTVVQVVSYALAVAVVKRRYAHGIIFRLPNVPMEYTTGMSSGYAHTHGERHADVDEEESDGWLRRPVTAGFNAPMRMTQT